MLAKELQRSFNKGTAGDCLASCPGKVFVLGEYSVLFGGPALVMAVGPRFELRAGGAGLSPAEQSPAAKLLVDTSKSLSAESQVRRAEFYDPHAGRGGFGASTAEFILAYEALGLESGWLAALKRYRELSSGSGADLVAQYLGGLVWFESTTLRAAHVSAPFESLFVFSATRQAGRKTATHSHINEITELASAKLLSEISRQGLEAALVEDAEGLGEAMNRYGDALRCEGLEALETRADREAFSAIDGVYGVKGAGAMQSDAIVVCANPEVASEVLTVAEARGLEPISIGEDPARGFA